MNEETVNKNTIAGDTLPDNVESLLGYALALEQEAQERYTELAAVMEMHNNHDVATLFKKMSALEKLHGVEIQDLLKQKGIKDLPSITYRWASPEGPETIDPMDLHYLMTPYQALGLALHNEQRAQVFFEEIAAACDDKETCELAAKLAEEEIEHVGWVRDWMRKYPETESDWDQDDDPAIVQD